VAKDNYPNLSSGDEWTGTDIAAFLDYMGWHRPDLASQFVLGGTVFQDELQPIMKDIDPDFHGPAPTPVIPEVPATVSSVAITGSPIAQVGVETYYKAIATLSDGNTQNVTSTATWISATPANTTVSAAGLVTGVAAGSATITAAQDGVTSPGVTVTVTTAP